MKNAVFLFILLTFVSFAVTAQEKALTQQEYVRMLYTLDRNFEERTNIIAELRRRGIDFELTDGIRSLTRTKGRNDADLRRALEEAERRRSNPSTTPRPSKAEGDKLIEKARQLTLEAVGDMPDFVVRQLIQRSAAYAGTGTFRNLDRLTVAVSYQAAGHEEYRVLSVNGVPRQTPERRNSYEDVGGTSSTGEFVSILSTVFKPESQTLFTVFDNDSVRERRAVVFDFQIERDRAKQGISYSDVPRQTTIAGMSGKIWIDKENFRVLRIESEATEIPEGFPITAAKRIIDYDWVVINEQKYLLPMLSDVRLTSRQQGRDFETRNRILFRDYQKFGTEVIILDDEEVIVEDEPVNNN